MWNRSFWTAGTPGVALYRPERSLPGHAMSPHGNPLCRVGDPGRGPAIAYLPYHQKRDRYTYFSSDVFGEACVRALGRTHTAYYVPVLYGGGLAGRAGCAPNCAGW